MNVLHRIRGILLGRWLRHLPASKIGNRITNVALAVVDQLAFSGTNFIVSVLLARWMDYQAYGAFTYAYSLYLLLSTFHNALILEPFTILGSTQYRHSMRSYFQQITQLQLYGGVIPVGVSALLGGILWLAGNQNVGQSLLGLAVALGAMLYFANVRRVWYVVRQIRYAVLATSVFSAVQLIAVYGLYYAGELTPFTAFAVVGIAAFVGAGAGRMTGKLEDVTQAPASLSHLAQEHWQYGKWVTLAGVFFWLTAQGYNILTGSILNLADTGGLKALQNLINPVVQLLTAFNLVFLPWIARQYAENGSPAMRRGLVIYSVFSTSCAIVYWIFLMLFRTPMFGFLYDGQYMEYSNLLPFLAIVPIISALTTSWMAGMRVLRQTQLLFWVDSAGAAFTISVGVLLVVQYGLPGAVAGSVLSTVSRIPVLIILWRRAIKTVIPERELSAE